MIACWIEGLVALGFMGVLFMICLALFVMVASMAVEAWNEVKHD